MGGEKTEQLFVLMSANICTGRREKRGVGRKGITFLDTYGRDTLNDNGQLLLSFANRHSLPLVTTLFSTPKGGLPHTFNERCKRRANYILTRQRNRRPVQNVTVHPQLSFLPISDHNLVTDPAKFIGHFARNRRLRTSGKLLVNCWRLMTDPQLRQEMTTAVGKHLRANSPGDSNVEDVQLALAATITRTAEVVIPPQERRKPGRA